MTISTRRLPKIITLSLLAFAAAAACDAAILLEWVHLWWLIEEQSKEETAKTKDGEVALQPYNNHHPYTINNHYFNLLR